MVGSTVALPATGFCILIVGAAVHLSGITTNQWMVSKNLLYRNYRAYFGLYRACSVGICVDVTSTDDMNTVRALTGLGVAFSGIASLLALWFLVQSVKKLKSLPWLVVGLSILTAVVNVAGLAKFGDDYFSEDSPMTFGFSFYFCMLGTAAILFGSVLFLFGARKRLEFLTQAGAQTNRGQILSPAPVGSVPYVYNSQQGVVYTQTTPGMTPVYAGMPPAYAGMPPPYAVVTAQGYPAMPPALPKQGPYPAVPPQGTNPAAPQQAGYAEPTKQPIV